MKIAFIGLKGGHHYHILEGARKLGGCQVVAVSDDDEKAVARLIEREPLAKGAQGYANARHLLEHTMMDLCFVSDENGQRAEQLIALAERGVDIVAEKPLATTLDDLQRVRKALAGSKSRLTMMLTMRHQGKYKTLRKLVQEGAVGQVRQVSTQKSYRLGERKEWQKHRDRLGGTIPFIGIHALDLMTWTTGLSYSRVAAFHAAGAVEKMKESEDSASLILEFAEGGTASSRLDYLRPATAPSHGDDRIRIAGTAGILEAVGNEPEIRYISPKDGPKQIKPAPSDNLFVEFIQAVRNKRPLPIPTEDSLRITDVVLKARQAADEQRVVTLKTSER